MFNFQQKEDRMDTHVSAALTTRPENKTRNTLENTIAPSPDKYHLVGMQDSLLFLGEFW